MKNSPPVPENISAEPQSFVTACITILYNGVACILLLFMVFSVDGRIIIPLLLYPVLGAILSLFSKGKIKLDVPQKTGFTDSIGFGLLISAAGIIYQSCDNYSLMASPHLWLPFGAITLAFLATVYKPILFIKENIVNAVFLIVIAIGYGYGSTTLINCVFDRSAPVIYKAAILDLSVTHSSKGRNYYNAQISPWGSVTEASDESIDYPLYFNLKIGDSVKVNYKQGMLYIPWYSITKN